MMFGFARWPAARETGNEGMREGVNSLMRYARRSRALIPCFFGRHPRSQHLRHAPRLRNAAAREIRRLCIEHFADAAHARFAQVSREGAQHFASLFAIAVHAQPRIDE